MCHVVCTRIQHDHEVCLLAMWYAFWPSGMLFQMHRKLQFIFKGQKLLKPREKKNKCMWCMRSYSTHCLAASHATFSLVWHYLAPNSWIMVPHTTQTVGFIVTLLRPTDTIHTLPPFWRLTVITVANGSSWN